MAEIKGQLLGIVLTLMVFGAVSIIIAKVYASTAAKVTDYSENIEVEAADQIGYDIPNFGQGFAGPGNVAFPGLTY